MLLKCKILRCWLCWKAAVQTCPLSSGRRSSWTAGMDEQENRNKESDFYLALFFLLLSVAHGRLQDAETLD